MTPFGELGGSHCKEMVDTVTSTDMRLSGCDDTERREGKCVHEHSEENANCTYCTNIQTLQTSLNLCTYIYVVILYIISMHVHTYVGG